MGQKPVKSFLALPLLLLVSTSCSSNTMWPRTQEFLDRLHCGMTEDQVAKVTGEFCGLVFANSDLGIPWDKVVRMENTTITLDFDESGLRQAEVIWIDGLLSADALPIRDFCAHEE